MKTYNVIIVYSPDGQDILFCQRTRAPYKGLYNLVGGKVEPGENHLDAAYRELFEETGIRRNDIELGRLMDFVYYPPEDCVVETYAGKLKQSVILIEEVNALCWLTEKGNDFFDMTRFAGEGNIGHMLEILKQKKEYFLS